VRDRAKLRRVFEPHGRGLPDHVLGDVADADAVRAALAGCDAVVHAAALVSLERRRASEVLETCARGVENVVAGAVAAGLGPVVYVSSATAIFHPGAPRIEPDSGIAPARSAYGRSKAAAERAVRALQERGAPVHVSYPAAVIGPDDPGLSESNHALRTFVKDCVFLTSGGFPAVDVRDVARVHARLVERGGEPSRCLVGGRFLTWAEVADLCDEVTGGRVRRIPIPGRLVRAMGRVGDAVKRFVDFDFPLTREAMEFATLLTPIETSQTLRELDVAFRPVRETFADALRWMAAAGRVDPRRVGLLAPG
jgi:nucleoside-diphosphate-sugar epimerase